jgi:hypothetical protein
MLPHPAGLQPFFKQFPTVTAAVRHVALMTLVDLPEVAVVVQVPQAVMVRLLPQLLELAAMGVRPPSRVHLWCTQQAVEVEHKTQTRVRARPQGWAVPVASGGTDRIRVMLEVAMPILAVAAVVPGPTDKAATAVAELWFCDSGWVNSSFRALTPL